MITTYSKKLETMMKNFYESLSEKDKRGYAAIESLKFEYGGKKYISDVLEVSTPTIGRGITDLHKKGKTDPARIRAVGGGAKTASEKIPELDDKFLEVLKEYTAGDPMNENIKWTDLTYTEIGFYLHVKRIDVSKPVIKNLLKKHGYKKRTAQKSLAIGYSANRNAQFKVIRHYMVISILFRLGQ